MSIPVMILGKSGSGKSFSMKNLDPKKTLVLQCLRKPLPFRSSEWKPCTKENQTGSLFVTDSWNQMIVMINKANNAGKTIIVIDDFQYLMANEFMRRSQEKGFDKFTELGKHAWEVIMSSINNPTDCRIYFLAHTDENEQGDIKCKTIGKMLDEKITLEGMFTIVLRASKSDSGNEFFTQSNGRDTCKSPYEMFDHLSIDNDLKLVDDTICNYYGIQDSTNNIQSIGAATNV